jgi:hypothetical protein
MQSGGVYVPTPCPAGTYRPSGSAVSAGAAMSDGLYRCITCPAGHSSAAGAAVCEPPTTSPTSGDPGSAISSSSQTVHLGVELVAVIAVSSAVVAGCVAAATVLHCRRRSRRRQQQHYRLGADATRAFPSRERRGYCRQQRCERYSDIREGGDDSTSNESDTGVSSGTGVKLDVDVSTPQYDSDDDPSVSVSRHGASGDHPSHVRRVRLGVDTRTTTSPGVAGRSTHDRDHWHWHSQRVGPRLSGTGAQATGRSETPWRVFFRVLGFVPVCSSHDDLLALLGQLEQLQSPLVGLPRYVPQPVSTT